MTRQNGDGHRELLTVHFAKIHQTLRITPPMVAGVTERVWDAEDSIPLPDAQETRTA